MTDDARLSRQTVPSRLFDRLEEIVLEEYGVAWLKDDFLNARFMAEMSSVIEMTDGTHLIGKPEAHERGHTFNLWVDYPVADEWDADELAFGIFANVSQDLFLACRDIDESSVNYRFLTGSMDAGHRGTLRFTGPHARELANNYRIRTTDGGHFHA